MLAFVGNRFFGVAIIALFIQQIIAASSTLWIARLAEAIISEQDVAWYLSIFIGSLLIVYIPGILSSVFLEKSQYVAIRKNVMAFLERHQGEVSLIYDAASTKAHKPWFTHRITDLVILAAGNTHQTIALLLNISLNIAVLGSVIDTELYYYYGISALILFIGYKCSSKLVARTASRSQAARNQFNHGLIEGWNDIAIGNISTLAIWRLKFQLHLQKTAAASVAGIWATSGLTGLIMCLGSLPIFWGIGVILSENHTNPMLASALVATLPRQLQIIQYMYDLFYYLFSWTGLSQQIQDYQAMMSPTEMPANLLQRIRWEAIQFQGNASLKNPQDLLTPLLAHTTGRITIRGENGVGKSSLLAATKMQFKEDAFLLPSKHPVTLTATEGGGSSGEYIVQAFQFIDKKVPCKILLLDEWDANLDDKNREALSLLIDKWAVDKLIVEVRHR